MLNNPKDKQYYDDLIYELKKICGKLSSKEIDQTTKERIEARKNEIITLQSNGTGPFETNFRMSVFNTDVLYYLRKIKYFVYKNPEIKYYNATTNIERFYNITQDPNYKKAFDTVIQELEGKKRKSTKQRRLIKPIEKTKH